MRRYLQGTLDFACGVYAVVNALSCTHSIDLNKARLIFQESLEEMAGRPDLFRAFCRNATDHYWLVRCMLARAHSRYGCSLELFQPFSNCLLPTTENESSLQAPFLGLYLPENAPPQGPASLETARQEALAVWQAFSFWLEGPAGRQKRAAVFRFHRFLPSCPAPVVSHWTTGQSIAKNTLILHDASSEQGALTEIEQRTLLPGGSFRPLLRIVPESVTLISAGGH